MVTIMIMIKKPKSKSSLIYETTYNQEITLTISNYLKQSTTLSGRNLRQYFFKGLVHLNHKKAHSQAKLKNGDLIQVFKPSGERQTLTPEKMLLDIVYENTDLLVINKPARLAVHPSGKITSGTLANGIAAYFEKTGLKIKVRPVNRLDYGTSGLVIFAKNAATQTALTEAIQKHAIKRIYYAVVQRIPDSKTGTVKLPIIEANGKRKVGSQGQPAVTHYQVINQYKSGALLELDIETGRTHQIRVHLSHIGHPILGDNQYGNPSSLINRPALHAGKLNFDASNFQIPELTAPFPEDYNRLLVSLQ